MFNPERASEENEIETGINPNIINPENEDKNVYTGEVDENAVNELSLEGDTEASGDEEKDPEKEVDANRGLKKGLDKAA